ncbi:hypothetical protein BLOT_008135 [Blomia tropicalis]|nr:hypothetical protein BLOT_008135 [Blomia tropicalis]
MVNVDPEHAPVLKYAPHMLLYVFMYENFGVDGLSSADYIVLNMPKNSSIAFSIILKLAMYWSESDDKMKAKSLKFCSRSSVTIPLNAGQPKYNNTSYSMAFNDLLSES